MGLAVQVRSTHLDEGQGLLTYEKKPLVEKSKQCSRAVLSEGDATMFSLRTVNEPCRPVGFVTSTS